MHYPTIFYAHEHIVRKKHPIFFAIFEKKHTLRQKSQRKRKMATGF